MKRFLIMLCLVPIACIDPAHADMPPPAPSCCAPDAGPSTVTIVQTQPLRWEVPPSVHQNELYEASFGELVRIETDSAQLGEAAVVRLPIPSDDDVGKQVGIININATNNGLGKIITGGPLFVPSNKQEMSGGSGLIVRLAWSGEGWVISP